MSRGGDREGEATGRLLSLEGHSRSGLMIHDLQRGKRYYFSPRAGRPI